MICSSLQFPVFQNLTNMDQKKPTEGLLGLGFRQVYQQLENCTILV